MQNKKIAITGGIGSGKSQLCSFFKNKGYPVFSCDDIYREMLGEEEYLAALFRAFPACFSNGVLNKAELSRLVFSNEEAREKLNALAHPLIMARLFEKMKEFPVSFAEVPLLFEGGVESQFDAVIAVTREREARISSIQLRDNLSREEILSRLNSQCAAETYEQKNCIVVINDGTVEDLNREGERLLKLLNL